MLVEFQKNMDKMSATISSIEKNFDKTHKALLHAIKWIKARRDNSFSNMEGADGDAFKLFSELYGMADKELSELRNIMESK